MKEEKLFDEFPSSDGQALPFFFFLEFYEQAQLKLHSSELRGSVGIVRLNCVAGKGLGCWVVFGYFLWLNCVVFCSELKGRQTLVVLNKKSREWKNLVKLQIPLIFQFLLFVKFERKN